MSIVATAKFRLLLGLRPPAYPGSVQRSAISAMSTRAPSRPGPKEKLVFREGELTGWRKNLKKFAFWSTFPLAYCFHLSFHFVESQPPYTCSCC